MLVSTPSAWDSNACHRYGPCIDWAQSIGGTIPLVRMYAPSDATLRLRNASRRPSAAAATSRSMYCSRDWLSAISDSARSSIHLTGRCRRIASHGMM